MRTGSWAAAPGVENLQLATELWAAVHQWAQTADQPGIKEQRARRTEDGEQLDRRKLVLEQLAKSLPASFLKVQYISAVIDPLK